MLEEFVKYFNKDFDKTTKEVLLELKDYYLNYLNNPTKKERIRLLLAIERFHYVVKARRVVNIISDEDGEELEDFMWGLLDD